MTSEAHKLNFCCCRCVYKLQHSVQTPASKQSSGSEIMANGIHLFSPLLFVHIYTHIYKSKNIYILSVWQTDRHRYKYIDKHTYIYMYTKKVCESFLFCTVHMETGLLLLAYCWVNLPKKKHIALIALDKCTYYMQEYMQYSTLLRQGKATLFM